MDRNRREWNKIHNKSRTKKEKYTCFYCGNEFVETNFYKSFGNFFDNIGKIPYCKQCIEKLYQHYFDKYTNEGCLTPEENAVKRVCMAMDIYYTRANFDSAMKKIRQDNVNISPMGQYMKTISLSQYKNKSYDNTVYEDEQKKLAESLMDMSNISERNVDEKTINPNIISIPNKTLVNMAYLPYVIPHNHMD